TFQVKGVVPMTGLAADRNLVPDYPGIAGSANLSDWDPPFPVDLKKIRQKDEDYWHQYRTTPKAFIPLSVGQQLWQSRFGKLTSIRLATPDVDKSFQTKLKESLDPNSMGVSVLPVRSQGLEASRGATDFGEYFVYFSFFLVISALLLAALFFKLGIEQRVREVGLLRAVGYGPRAVRRLFLAEGIVLALAGSVLGVLGAVGYAAAIMYGLRTWWSGAVGTTGLTLHVSPASLVIGALGGIVAAVVCIAWTLRSLKHVSERSLLAGQLDSALDAKTLSRGRGRLLI